MPEWVCNAMEVAGIDISPCCAPFLTSSDERQFFNPLLADSVQTPMHDQEFADQDTFVFFLFFVKV